MIVAYFTDMLKCTKCHRDAQHKFWNV